MQLGFHVEYISYYMARILPPIWTIRKLKNMMRSSTPQDLTCDERKIVTVVNEILTVLQAQEARQISRRWRIPFGTSVIAVGKMI